MTTSMSYTAYMHRPPSFEVIEQTLRTEHGAISVFENSSGIVLEFPSPEAMLAAIDSVLTGYRMDTVSHLQRLLLSKPEFQGPHRPGEWQEALRHLYPVEHE